MTGVKMGEVPEGWSVDPGLSDAHTAFLYPTWWNEILGTWPSLCGLQADTYDQYYSVIQPIPED